METCSEELRRGIAAKTCGDEMQRRLAAKKFGKESCDKVAEDVGEELRKQICKYLGEKVAKNGRKHFRSQNSKAKIPHPKFLVSRDGPFCVAEPLK